MTKLEQVRSGKAVLRSKVEIVRSGKAVLRSNNLDAAKIMNLNGQNIAAGRYYWLDTKSNKWESSWNTYPDLPIVLASEVLKDMEDEFKIPENLGDNHEYSDDLESNSLVSYGQVKELIAKMRQEIMEGLKPDFGIKISDKPKTIDGIYKLTTVERDAIDPSFLIPYESKVYDLDKNCTCIWDGQIWNEHKEPTVPELLNKLPKD